MDYLTLRDWKENHVKVLFNLDGGQVQVVSSDNGISYFKSKDRKVVQEFINDSEKQLTYIYQNQFDKIQEDFRKLINY